MSMLFNIDYLEECYYNRLQCIIHHKFGFDQGYIDSLATDRLRINNNIILISDIITVTKV